MHCGHYGSGNVGIGNGNVGIAGIIVIVRLVMGALWVQWYCRDYGNGNVPIVGIFVMVMYAMWALW